MTNGDYPPGADEKRAGPEPPPFDVS